MENDEKQQRARDGIAILEKLREDTLQRGRLLTDEERLELQRQLSDVLLELADLETDSVS